MTTDSSTSAGGRQAVADPLAKAAGVLLRAVDLGRRVPGEPERWLFRGMSLDLGDAEIVALEGPTGAGKTLFLRSLAALDPTDEGRLELLGRPFSSWSPPSWRRTAVYVHQTAALPEGTVEGALREPFGFDLHADRAFDRVQALALFERLGRAVGFLGRQVTELSGGEAQAVALVRALLMEPRVLLLDEPTAAMDPDTVAGAEEIVRGWVRPPESAAGGRAVLWVTHQAAQAVRVAVRRLRLVDDGIREVSAVDDGPEGPPDGGGP